MIKLRDLLSEGAHPGKTFISVDIQPEYEKSFGFRADQFCEYLNENTDFGKLVFLYNGRETIGLTTEEEYRFWLSENGLNEDVMANAHFYDKGYAFFRYCMDSQLDENVVANFVRFMYQNGITDSRDMTRGMWKKYLKKEKEHSNIDKNDVFNLLEHASDCVHIPDLMDYIKNFRNIVLTGGGMNECLKEVEIALKALGMPYEIERRFTY